MSEESYLVQYFEGDEEQELFDSFQNIMEEIGDYEVKGINNNSDSYGKVSRTIPEDLEDKNKDADETKDEMIPATRVYKLFDLFNIHADISFSSIQINENSEFVLVNEYLTFEKIFQIQKVHPIRLICLYSFCHSQLNKIEDTNEILEKLKLSEEDFDFEVYDLFTSFVASSLIILKLYIASCEDPTMDTQDFILQENYLSRILSIFHSFLTSHFIETSFLMGSRKENKGNSKNNSLKINEKRFLDFDIKILKIMVDFIFPSLISFCDLFKLFSKYTILQHSLGIILCELMFSILMLNPHCCIPTNKYIYIIEGKYHVQFRKLQKSTIETIREIFIFDDTYRNNIIYLNISLLHQTYSYKTIYKPHVLEDVKSLLTFLDSSNVNSNQYHVSNGVICILNIIQALVKEGGILVDNSMTKQDYDNENNLALCSKYSLVFLSEMLQRCSSKESYADHYETIHQMTLEVIISLQSISWPGSIILFEQLTISLLYQIKRLMNDLQLEGKKEYGPVNCVLEILASIMEKLYTINLNYNQKIDYHVPEFSPIIEQIKQLLYERWKKEFPYFLQLLSEYDNSDESNQDQQPSTPLKTKKIPFFRSLDIILEIIAEVNSGVDELQGLIESSMYQKIKRDYALSLSLQLLSVFATEFPSITLLQNIGNHDIIFSILFKHLAEKNNHSPLFYQSDHLSESYSNSIRDSVMIYCNQWSLYYKEPMVVNDNCANDNENLFKISEISQLSTKITQRPKDSNSFALNRSNLPLFLHDYHTTQHVIPSHTASYLYCHMLNHNVLHKTIIRILDSNIFLFHHELASSAIRSKVVKSISKLVQVDYSLLFVKAMKQMLHNIFHDKSISVREEGVRLIGPFLSTSNQLLVSTLSITKKADENLDILEDLKALLHDEGISVRKSVVMIFKDILFLQPHHSQYQDLSKLLLLKLSEPKEEDSIKEMIRNIFQFLWFSSPSSSSLQIFQIVYEESNVYLSHLENTLSSENNDNHSNNQLLVNLFTNKLNPISNLCLLNSAIHKAKHILPLTSTKGYVTSETQKYQEENIKQVYIEFISFQLIEISMEESFHNIIFDLMHEVFLGRNNGTDDTLQIKQKQTISVDYCRKIITFLIEILLMIEEKNELIVKFIYFKAQHDFHGKIENTLNPLVEYKINIILFISLFCKAYPLFLNSYLYLFLPYLKIDSNLSSIENQRIMSTILIMLESTLMLDHKHSLIQSKSSELLIDLANIAFSQSGKVISLAIKCFSLISLNITNDAMPYYKLIEKCYFTVLSVVSETTLINNLSQNNSGKKTTQEGKIASLSIIQSGKIQRYITVLGHLCEHAKYCRPFLVELFNNNNGLSTDKNAFQRNLTSKIENQALTKTIVNLLPQQPINPQTFYGECYILTLHCLKYNDVAVQLRAIQALCCIFTGFPRLMNVAQKEEVINWILSDNFSDPIKEKFILGLKELMVAEEERLERQSTIQHLKDSGIAISAQESVLGSRVDADSDATIAGFVLQQHLPKIGDFLKHKTATIRSSTLQLINILLRQGMVCPLDVISMVIMLIGDVEEEIRVNAFHLIQLQDERHPNFLENRLLEGLEMIHNFQVQTFGHKLFYENDITQSKGSFTIFNSFYQKCIQQSKKRKTNFLSGCLRKSLTYFPNYMNEINKRGASYRMHLFQDLLVFKQLASKTFFMILIISSIPFEFVEDVLFIITWINSNVPVAISMLLNQMKQILVHLANDFTIEAEEINSANASTSFPFSAEINITPLKIESYLNQQKDFLHIFRDFHTLICLEYQLRCVELLMLLKVYLKNTYNLSNEKCQEFDPNDRKTTSTGVEKAIRNESNGDFIPVARNSQSFEIIFSKDIYLFFQNFNELKSQNKLINIFYQFVTFCTTDYYRIEDIMMGDPDEIKLVGDLKKRKSNANNVHAAPPKKSKTTPTKSSSKLSNIKGKKKVGLQLQFDDDFDEIEAELEADIRARTMKPTNGTGVSDLNTSSRPKRNATKINYSDFLAAELSE